MLEIPSENDPRQVAKYEYEYEYEITYAMGKLQKEK